MTDAPRQPLLHDLITCLAAPCTVLSGQDAQIREASAQGVLVGDVRVISRAELRVQGAEPEAIAASMVTAGTAEFVALVRSVGDDVPDPTVWVRRMRHAVADGCDETITVVNATDEQKVIDLELRLASDGAGVETIKKGLTAGPTAYHEGPEGLTVSGSSVTISITAPAGHASAIDGGGIVHWRMTVPARGRLSAQWSVHASNPDAELVAASTEAPAPFTPITVSADDRRLAPFVERSIDDLSALRMCTAAQPQDVFVAAGSPWYFTLFGRDSIWAARMMLPLGTDIARGTLRTLAASQGTTSDPATGEQPGKILHELRRPSTSALLPPVYYGTVDATPLWVCLLADAWRWGLDPDVVAPLLPTAERALAWMTDDGDADGDGFLEYADTSGKGLANQGWKDSGDSVRFADGRIAEGPIALAEVQGYAHEAALAGADLLEAFDRPGADRWRDYAADLAARFRERFWVSDGHGPYPAMALDGDKRPVDAPTSNIGHLLASGMLNDAEARHIAERLVHPSMSSGFGLRTMSSECGGYSPLSYHCGSVWPHDTAIAIHGLLRAGFAQQAGELANGLLAAGAAFDGRLPELYGGFAKSDIGVPVPYPAACRPQAWSAASAVVMLQAWLGLAVDVPSGGVDIRPPAVGIGAITVDGLQVSGRALHVSLSVDSTVTARLEPGEPHLQLRTRDSLRTEVP